MFHRCSQGVVHSLIALARCARPVLATAALLSLWHPAAVLAQNLVLTGGNELIGAQGGLNEFGNLDGDYRTFNSNDIHGFPSSGSASPSAVAASASLSFLYTQMGDVSTFTQTISEQQDGVPQGMAEHRFTIEFTAVTDLSFTFTSNYNGLGTAGSPQYYVVLLDSTTLSNVFADNSQDPNDLIPVENHVGTLIAGHSYSLNGASRLYAGDSASGVPASATGTYVFTTAPIETNAVLTSEIVSGPDRDDDGVIDDTIPVRADTPSEFSFTVTYSSPGTTDATITDTIPKEWEIVSVISDDPADQVEIFSSGPGRGLLLKGKTTYEWTPTDSAGTATVTIRTRTLGRRKYEPNRSGVYDLNTGAKALNGDGTPVLDEDGNALVGPVFTVEAP